MSDVRSKLVYIGAALLVVVIAVVSNRTTSTPESTARPGNPAVYREIAAETNCARLQEMFDIADANHERAVAANDLDQMAWTLGYMQAADDRMRALGCYR